MDAEIKKIMDLVANGTITKEQGDILLRALNEKKSDEFDYENDKKEDYKETVISLGDKIGKTVTNALNKTGKLLSELNIDRKINQAIDESIREIKNGKKKFSVHIHDDDEDDDDDDYEDDDEHGNIDMTFNNEIIEKKKYIEPLDSRAYEDRRISIKFVDSKRVIKRDYTVSQFLAAPENLDKAVNIALSFAVLDLINERFTGKYKYVNNSIVFKVQIY